MAIEFKWVVDSLETVPEVNGQQNVVSRVNWRLLGKEFLEGYTRHHSFFGTTPIPYVDTISFTTYENLTSEQVVDWVKQAVGQARVQAYEAHVAEVLSTMVPAAAVTTPLPWAR